ncbi:MAG: hypothetical protein LAO24_12350 [Acidobacteriia bacterium]|nr:hypothetical protein [Terriglobia bacterium]
MRFIATRAIFVLITSAFFSSAVSASAQNIVIGVLEDTPGHYAGEPNYRDVRAVFRKSGTAWQVFPNDCPDQDCLEKIASAYPGNVTWTIAFDGKNLGQVTTGAPKEYKWYSSVGQQDIISTGSVPTVGEKSAQFAGWADVPVYRPLVANSQPYFTDPDIWKPFSPKQELVRMLQQQFRKWFPKLCRLGGPNSSEMIPFAYRNEDVKLVKAYGSKTGWVVARLHLEAVDCKDVEAGFDIDDPWFVIDLGKSVRYVGAGMWLVDAGDYDNDGKAEILFSIDRYNRGGYELFYDDFKKHVTFEFSYH